MPGLAYNKKAQLGHLAILTDLAMRETIACFSWFRTMKTGRHCTHYNRKQPTPETKLRQRAAAVCVFRTRAP